MATDWALIRDLMAAVIDSAEDIEASGYGERDQDRTVQVGAQAVSLHDVMVSAQTIADCATASSATATTQGPTRPTCPRRRA